MTDTVHLTCSQCGKPSISEDLCIDCLWKYDVAQTLRLQNEIILVNQAAAEMDTIVPFGAPTPRMQLPEIPKKPIVMHNIHISDSVVGSINTGTVGTVDVHITHLKQGGNNDLADALRQLTEAIANEPTLISDTKNNLLDQVAYLSEQASGTAKDRKRGMIKAVIDSLDSFAQSSNSMATIVTAWQQAEPLLKTIFGL